MLITANYLQYCREWTKNTSTKNCDIFLIFNNLGKDSLPVFPYSKFTWTSVMTNNWNLISWLKLASFLKKWKSIRNRSTVNSENFDVFKLSKLPDKLNRWITSGAIAVTWRIQFCSYLMRRNSHLTCLHLVWCDVKTGASLLDIGLLLILDTLLGTYVSIFWLQTMDFRFYKAIKLRLFPISFLCSLSLHF